MTDKDVISFQVSESAEGKGKTKRKTNIVLIIILTVLMVIINVAVSNIIGCTTADIIFLPLIIVGIISCRKRDRNLKTLIRAFFIASLLTTMFSTPVKMGIYVFNVRLAIQQGRYAEAIPIAEKILAITEKALGPDHPDTATSLNSLAVLYYSLGDYAKAEPLYKRALAIKEKALGPEHPATATSLNNLAALYYSLGDYEKAEPLLKRALAIREKALGPDHPDTAISLGNLAALCRSIGYHAKAEPLYKRSLAINEKALGPDHPATAASLNNLALLYHSLGDYAKDYAKAEPLYKRALVIWEKALGPDHPDTAGCLGSLASLYAATDKFEKALNLYKQAQQSDEKLIDQVMGFTSEQQKLAFLSTLSTKKEGLHAFLSLVTRHLNQNPSARTDALDAWLRRKGVILESQKRFQDALLYSGDPQAVKIFQELSRVRGQISRLVFSDPGNVNPETYRQRLADLESEKQRLEAELSRISQVYALTQKIAKADCGKIADALPENTALIEFAMVPLSDFKEKDEKKQWSPPHYLAFVLHAGKGNDVSLTDLGEAEAIDKAVATYKKLITLKNMEMSAEKYARNVYDLIFAPLKTALGDVKEIFVSPDGSLSLIPFEILRGPDGKFLIEDYTFNYLAAGRDILGFGQIAEKGGKSLIMGDPDFDMGSEEKAASLKTLALKTGGKAESLSRSSDMRGTNFKRLPHTKAESEAVHSLLGRENSELYTDRAALEEVLLGKTAPKILHLATHGFFMKDTEIKGDIENEMMSMGMQPEISFFSQKGGLPKTFSPGMTGKFAQYQNPLLRSGIALAGANTALQSENPENSDGIVTAEKILGLKLRGTDMVVLSACETGLGDVKSGEGIYGLRRAFTQAGTKSLVMSMWAVPDKESMELMSEFYKNILSGKMRRNQSLREAVLKQIGTVNQRYGSPSPLFWGAFVFMGES